MMEDNHFQNVADELAIVRRSTSQDIAASLGIANTSARKWLLRLVANGCASIEEEQSSRGNQRHLFVAGESLGRQPYAPPARTAARKIPKHTELMRAFYGMK